MLVTVDWIGRNYKKFNKMYFNNKLPDISFKVSRSKDTWGYASFKYVYEGRILKTIKPTCITISNYYDSPEEVKLTTLLHEMIHIEDYTFFPEHYVKYGRRRSGHSYDAHGYWFKNECKRLKEFGWEIEKYVTEEEKSISTLSENAKNNLERKKNEALACIVSSDKMIYIIKTDINKISIIKRTINKTGRLNWERFLCGEIKSIKFYRTSNDKFAEKRSCATKLSGSRIIASSFDNYKEKYNLVEYKIAA